MAQDGCRADWRGELGGAPAPPPHWLAWLSSPCDVIAWPGHTLALLNKIMTISVCACMLLMSVGD